MPEEKKVLKTFEIDYICDRCGVGKMRNDGCCFPTSPPQCPHKCTNCGAEKTFNCNYPKIVYESEE